MSDKHPSVNPASGLAGIYTETLARLYAQQGLYDQALTIYRHLVRTQPENQAWQRSIAALEQQRTITAVTPETSGETAEPTSRGYPVEPRERLQQVMARLERWLEQLRRQRRS